MRPRPKSTSCCRRTPGIGSRPTEFLKALHGLVAMLDTPALDLILAGVEKRPEATLGELLGFMNAFNFRFGPATTPTAEGGLRRAVSEARGSEEPGSSGPGRRHGDQVHRRPSPESSSREWTTRIFRSGPRPHPSRHAPAQPVICNPRHERRGFFDPRWPTCSRAPCDSRVGFRSKLVERFPGLCPGG